MSARRPADKWLLVVVGLLTATGAIMVFSASSVVAYTQYHDAAYFLKRELMWIAVGLVAAWAGAAMDYGKLRKAAPWLMGLSVLLLLAVLVPHVGTMQGGARRWLSLGATSFEPSEFAKLALVIFLASLLADRASSDLGGTPELVRHGTDGFIVPPDDPDAIASALQALVNDPARARAMGKAARERALTDFAPDVHLARLDGVYAEACCVELLEHGPTPAGSCARPSLATPRRRRCCRHSVATSPSGRRGVGSG